MTVMIYFDLLTILVLTLIWVCIVMFLYLKKSKRFMYLLFFTIFYIYLVKVLDYTLFQFQSLLLLKHFVPKLILKGQAAEKSINFVPLITLTAQDLKTSLLNVALFIPFGFGLPFITEARSKRTILIGAVLSILIESLQLLTGYMAKLTFRVTDINDTIFNTIGATIGYFLCIGFVIICRRLFHHRKTFLHPIVRYITERPQIDK